MDSYTLTVATSLLGIIMAFIMFAMYKASPKETCLLDWALAGAVTAVAYNWFSFTNHLPDYLSLAVTNALFIAIYLAILRGVLSHAGYKRYDTYMFLVLIVVWGLHFIPSIASNVNSRIVMFAAIKVPIQLILIIVLLKAWKISGRWSYLPLALVAALPILDISFRSIIIILSDIPQTDSAGNHWLHSLGWFSNLLYTSTATFSCALIIVHQQFSKLAQQKVKLEQKNDEVIAAQQELVQSKKMASLGTMTAGIAHEINNPTNFTHASVYMMKDEIDSIKQFLIQLAGGEKADSKVVKSFDDKFRKLTELTTTAQEGTNRIKAIVKDLQVFSRLSNDKKTEVKLSELLESTISLAKTQYSDFNIKINFNYDPIVHCFPSKINQVFLNIVMNAYQAINDRKMHEPSLYGIIDVWSEQHDNNIIVHFKDNGCGMSEESLEKIFDPFYTTKEVGTGTGLGMAISYNIIEEHDSDISVHSEEGIGTEITLSLPV